MGVASVQDVVEGGFCIGCGACAVASGGAITLRRNAIGSMEVDLDASQAESLLEANACPFSDASKDETALSARFGDVADPDPHIGYHSGVFAGQISDRDAIYASSSGGMTSWLLDQLIERGLVDGVVHVGMASGRGEGLFEYAVSRSREDNAAKKKSIYYSTDMSSALNAIIGDGKRYAVVGVPCFIKAVSLLMAQDSDLAKQIVFRVGLVCGHLKSAAFAECLAWQAGVAPDELQAIDFRVKRPGEPANKYAFAALSSRDGGWRTGLTSDALGGNWGHGMFQLNACNYCDDIFAETADICFGDAWLPRYSQDPLGTNLVIARDPALREIVLEGGRTGALTLDVLTPSDAIESQAGNFRHRWDGLSVRLADDARAALQTPRKRIKAGSRPVPLLRRKLIRLRRKMTQVSHIAFAEAKAAGDFALFERRMAPMLRRMRNIYRIESLSRRFRPARYALQLLNII